MPPEDVRVATVSADPDPEGHTVSLLRGYFPPLSLVEERTLVRLFRPSTEVVPPSRPGDMAPVLMAWHSGFFGPQQDPKFALCHCGSHTGKVTLVNPSSRPRTVTLDFHALPANWQAATLRVEGPEFADELKVTFTDGHYQRTLTLPPGKTVLQVSCDARRLPTLADKVNIVFHAMNIRLREGDAGFSPECARKSP
jgi:hypothetical protein